MITANKFGAFSLPYGSSYCKSLCNASTWRGISLIRCVPLSDNHTEATQIESPPAFLQHKDHCLANCSPQICFLPLTNTSWRHKKIKDPWVHLLLLVNHSWWRSMKWSMPSPQKNIGSSNPCETKALTEHPSTASEDDAMTIQFENCETTACHLQLEINPYQFVYGTVLYRYTSPWWVVVLHQYWLWAPKKNLLGWSPFMGYAKLWGFWGMYIIQVSVSWSTLFRIT